MQVVFKNIREDFKKYNILSRYIIRIGTPVLIAMSLVAVIFKALIITDTATDWVYVIFPDLLEAIKEGFGAVYFGAFLLELLHIVSIKRNDI